ncbi:MAG: RidA family protein [Acidobacteriota bacterium]
MQAPRPIRSGSAPEAIGPYTQAIAAGDLIFLSGQIALDPKSGEMTGGGLEEEAARVLDNLGAVLAAAGSGYDRVVKTTVYLTDLADFEALNRVYARYFGTGRPARSTVQVASLPRGARVEIDAIALAG